MNKEFNKEFKEFIVENNKLIPVRLNMLIEFENFILQNAIHEESEMIFMTADNYYIGEFEGASFGAEEKVWDCLENLVGIDFNSIEREFMNVEFLDNENTAIATINNKEYAILVA